MAAFSFSYYSLIYVLLLIAFLVIRSPQKKNIVKLCLVNKLLFGLEFLVIGIILLLSLSLVTFPDLLFTGLVFLSIVSMVSLIIVMVQTILGSEHIQVKFIYAAHMGLLILLIGFLGLFDPYRADHSRQTPPLEIFLMGIFILIPYFHVMIVHRFFSKTAVEKLESE